MRLARGTSPILMTPKEAEKARVRTVASLIVLFMTAVVRLLGPGGTKALIAENLALRHQLLVLNRKRRRAPSLRPLDRLLLGLSAIFIGARRIPKIAIVIRPSTILQFHRALVRSKYQALFTPKRRSKPGPKGPSAEMRAAIVAIKTRNPRFGCRKIAMIVSRTFGVEIDKDVVRRVLARDFRPEPGHNGPSWLSFLGHTKDSLWSVDLFRCESIILKSHWVLIVLDQYTRRIIGFGIHQDPIDGPRVCRMFNQATAGHPIPRRVSTDHDPLFRDHRWQANLRVLDVEEIKTVPYVPLSHPFVERAIGTVRREYLDHMLFWNSLDLQRKLDEFKTYYNANRVHVSLEGQTPLDVATETKPDIVDLNNFRWASHCGGLVQLPVAA